MMILLSKKKVGFLTVAEYKGFGYLVKIFKQDNEKPFLEVIPLILEYPNIDYYENTSKIYFEAPIKISAYKDIKRGIDCAKELCGYLDKNMEELI